jgi:hypothetical protein
MHPNLTQLTQQYNVLCCVDLGNITHQPDALHRVLAQHYRNEYQDSDRLVFYTDYAISNELVDHIRSAALLIDVSSYFILLCGPNVPDNTEFSSLRISVGHTVELGNNYRLPETVCPLPWMHLEVMNQGEISPCCIYQGTIGTLPAISLNTAFYGTHMEQLRLDFLNNKKPSGCATCWAREDHGLVSNRKHHNNLLKKSLLTQYLSNPGIVSLDLKPGNTCNFKCRICNPRASSVFAQEVVVHSKDQLHQSYNWAELAPQVFSEVEQLLPNMTNIDMYGGEPFLIKQLSSLIHLAVEQNHAQHIRLHYNSNGSIYPETLVNLWKEFEHVDLHFSIDNVGARFELERGGTWSTVESNILRLLDLGLPNLKISIMPVISIMNIYYLDELLEWAQLHDLPVNPLYLDRPEAFAITNMTAAAQQLIINKYQGHSWSEMKNILAIVQQSTATDGKKFVQLTAHFDKIRNQSFQDSHTAIANAMGMC